jgi:hypothetical protein
LLERLAAIVRSDHARLLDPTDAAESEAEALVRLPASHPRRLAFCLFVATAALEHDDPESAVKALRLLHSRDVMPSPARLLVNWLLGEAARRSGDAELAARCEEALRSYDLRREAEVLTAEDFEANDPYALWVGRARRSMTGGGGGGTAR